MSSKLYNIYGTNMKMIKEDNDRNYCIWLQLSSYYLSFYLSVGNNCPCISDDLNEDTISVLVRLITEKKGKKKKTFTSRSCEKHLNSFGFDEPKSHGSVL